MATYVRPHSAIVWLNNQGDVLYLADQASIRHDKLTQHKSVADKKRELKDKTCGVETKHGMQLKVTWDLGFN